MDYGRRVLALVAADLGVGDQDPWGRWRRALALVAKILGVGGGTLWGRSGGMSQTYTARHSVGTIRGVGTRPFVGPTPFVPRTYPRYARDLPRNNIILCYYEVYFVVKNQFLLFVSPEIKDNFGKN